MYDMKALYEAHSVEEAVRLRLEHPEAQIIAGGTDVLVQMREGRRAGKELISIQKVDEIRGICMDEQENIRIGSLTTFSHITHDPIIIERINVLGEAVDMVGGPQIRNAGTIGGNTCNGVTSADSASTLHAWEAIIELTGVNGKRYLPIKDFYIKAGTVDINVAEGEIQTAVLIRRPPGKTPRAFTSNTACATLWKLPRPAAPSMCGCPRTRNVRPCAHRLRRRGSCAHARTERRGRCKRPARHNGKC